MSPNGCTVRSATISSFFHRIQIAELKHRKKKNSRAQDKRINRTVRIFPNLTRWRSATIFHNQSPLSSFYLKSSTGSQMPKSQNLQITNRTLSKLKNTMFSADPDECGSDRLRLGLAIYPEEEARWVSILFLVSVLFTCFYITPVSSFGVCSCSNPVFFFRGKSRMCFMIVRRSSQPSRI